MLALWKTFKGKVVSVFLTEHRAMKAYVVEV